MCIQRCDGCPGRTSTMSRICKLYIMPPAFDPVRDAVLNSPVEQHSSSLVSPLASPSLGRRATDLSVLLNSDSTMPPARPSSLSHLMAPDKLTSSVPLERRYAGSSSRSSQAPYPAPVQAQMQRRRESPSPTRYEREYQFQDSRYPNSRPSSSSSTSTTHTNTNRTSGAPGSSNSVLKRQTSSPSMPPPPAPQLSANTVPIPKPSPSPTPAPMKSSIPYRPTKRLTPAGAVLKPLTPEEIEMYRSFQGQGARRLSMKRKRSRSEESDAPPLKKFHGDVRVIAQHCTLTLFSVFVSFQLTGRARR